MFSLNMFKLKNVVVAIRFIILLLLNRRFKKRVFDKVFTLLFNSEMQKPLDDRKKSLLLQLQIDEYFQYATERKSLPFEYALIP